MNQKIKLILAYGNSEEVFKLFSEYTNMLIEKDSSFKEYLSVQNYEKELENLKDKYGEPYGRLYLAYFENKLAGCVALKKIDENNCEMKRLYVRKKFRGNNIANYLIEKIVADAREIGYSFMLLDTLPFLTSAIYLYKKYGFYEIESYNNSPMKSSIYMKLDL